MDLVSAVKNLKIQTFDNPFYVVNIQITFECVWELKNYILLLPIFFYRESLHAV